MGAVAGRRPTFLEMDTCGGNASAALARAGVHTLPFSRTRRFGLFGLDRDEYIHRMRAGLLIGGT